MNTVALIFVAVCAVLLLSVRTTDALECYQCTNCNDPFVADGVTKITCSGSCSKTTATQLGNTVTRDCMPLGEKNSCEELLGIEACACTTDLCNGSSGLTMSLIVTGVIAAIGSLFRMIV